MGFNKINKEEFEILHLYWHKINGLEEIENYQSNTFFLNKEDYFTQNEDSSEILFLKNELNKLKELGQEIKKAEKVILSNFETYLPGLELDDEMDFWFDCIKSNSRNIDFIKQKISIESQIQVNNTPTTKKQEYRANEFALVYIFDLYAKGKRIPINEIEGGLAKKVIESNKPKNCTIKPNTFYKAVQGINRDFDVNKKRDLENISKRWKEVLKELSNDWETLKNYLTEKELM